MNVKGIVQPEMTIHHLFLILMPNLYDFFFCGTHTQKKDILRNVSVFFFFHIVEVNGNQKTG